LFLVIVVLGSLKKSCFICFALSEKDYSLVIYSLAIERKKKEAFEMMSDMNENKFKDEIRPGSSCYAACMLAAMQDSDMEGVLTLSQKMIEDSIPPNAMTVHGALLASSRLQDREKAVEVLRYAADHGISLSSGSLRYIMSFIIVETTCTTYNSVLADYRKRLEDFARKQNVLLTTEALDLSEAIGIAEAKANQKLLQHSTVEEIQEREHDIWKNILIKGLALLEKMGSSNHL
jgi:hypothetical protein